MYTFVWFSGAIWETPSKKTAVILSHLYVIGVKIVQREITSNMDRVRDICTMLSPKDVHGAHRKIVDSDKPFLWEQSDLDLTV